MIEGVVIGLWFHVIFLKEKLLPGKGILEENGKYAEKTPPSKKKLPPLRSC